MTSPAPARRPLSPKAAAYAAGVQQLADERMARIVKAHTPPAAPRPTVRKAKGDPMIAVYDANQNLVGICPQDSVQMLAQASVPAAKPASDAGQAGGARQAPPTQAPQAGPAAAAADPSQPGAIPVGPNQLADDQDQDPTTAAVAKALAQGRLEGVTAELRKRAADGSPREKQEAFDALQVLGLLKFQQLRAAGGRRQM